MLTFMDWMLLCLIYQLSSPFYSSAEFCPPVMYCARSEPTGAQWGFNPCEAPWLCSRLKVLSEVYFLLYSISISSTSVHLEVHLKLHFGKNPQNIIKHLLSALIGVLAHIHYSVFFESFVIQKNAFYKIMKDLHEYIIDRSQIDLDPSVLDICLYLQKPKERKRGKKGKKALKRPLCTTSTYNKVSGYS